MQRDRLEGWMVRQIEHADLAKETVIQLPASRVTASKASDLRSPRSALGSPRRRFLGHTAVQRPHSTPQPSQHQPLSPADRIRDRALSPRSRLDTAAAVVGELDGEDSIARQWRLRFQDPGRSFAEDGRVDRSQVLKGMSPRPGDMDEDEWDDELGAGDAGDGEPSPLTLWGMPREYILEYIRQSVMPTSWTTHARFTGEWEAVPPSKADGRYAPKSVLEDAFESSSLPPLSSRQKSNATPTSPLRSPRVAGSFSAPPGNSSPSRTYRRPHPGATFVAPTSPRLKPPRCEERIHQILTELRADPKTWAAFQKDVKRYIADKQKKQHDYTRNREKRNITVMSPRAPDVLAERKRQNDKRLQRAQRHRTLLIKQEDDKLEAKLLAYRRKTQAASRGGEADDKPFDITATVGYRKRKTWLLVIAFAVTTTQLQQRLVREKQRQILDKMQSKAARVIQNLWKKWKWRHASKQTIVIYTWLRKCLWKLMFKMRCRRKHRHATVLQRFMLDQLSGSRETRNFNRMMVKWRGKVILSQRLSVSFINCTRARLLLLSMWWDALDHERQRGERQLHEKLLPTTDDKEAEWNAMVGSRGRLMRRPSNMNGSSRNLSISSTNGAAQGSSTANPSTVPTTPVIPLASSGSASSLSRRSVSTRQLLDQMDERLTTMQQVLTPFEIQRLQQHAFHVVKVPKAIKMRLLQELLTAARKDYMHQLTTYQDQVACASYAREVRLDDARAIVQSGASWGSLITDTRTGHSKLRRPVFQLYSGDKQKRMMEELVKRGVQLTLESDPEQRSIVERQRQQRHALEAGVSPGGSSGGIASAMSSSRKREMSSSSSTQVPLPPSSGSTREDGRRASRKLTFAIPATIKENGKGKGKS